MQLALDELHGLEVLPLELTGAMRIMVDDPDATPQRWLGGQDPFQAARGGDATDDPRIGTERKALAGPQPESLEAHAEDAPRTVDATSPAAARARPGW